MNQVRSTQYKFVPPLFSGASAVAAVLCLSMFTAPARAQYHVQTWYRIRPEWRHFKTGTWSTAGVSSHSPPVRTGSATTAVDSQPCIPPRARRFSSSCRFPLHLRPRRGPSALRPAFVGNISPNPSDFTFTGNGISGRAAFIFASLDGTIGAWNPTVDPTNPTTHVSVATLTPADRSSAGAVYTGLAIAVNDSKQAFLYAADDSPNRRIDMFDSSFNFVKSFSDPDIPQDFTPYGIQAINGQIWVTYTALNKAQGGFVDVFDAAGNLVKHFAVHGPLHSPWGIAKAPANFGPMSNAILISNNTSRGRVNAFNPETGDFLGPLRDATGQPIEIDQLWAIQFGQGAAANGPANQLFFTAGPSNYANGLFGTITLAK